MGSTHVVVGRIGRPHGIRGELSVEPRTDEPDRRFVVGNRMDTETPRGSAPHGPGRPAILTVESIRWHQDRLLVRFEEVGDRTAAEAVRGLALVLDVPADEAPADPEEFYDHQLIGLRVETVEGVVVGELASVQHGAAQDLLVVRRTEGGDVLVPFVEALVPTVDLPAGRLLVADRPGLLTPLDDT
ncbi:MAG: ribosome maturation factor RimM [Nocardioides sp.]